MFGAHAFGAGLRSVALGVGLVLCVGVAAHGGDGAVTPSVAPGKLLTRTESGTEKMTGLGTPISKGIVPLLPVELGTTGRRWCRIVGCDLWQRLEAAFNGAAEWFATFPDQELRFDGALGLSMIRQTVDSEALRRDFETARKISDGDDDNPERRFWISTLRSPPEDTSRWKVPTQAGERVNTNRVIEEALHCVENGWRPEVQRYLCGPMRDNGSYQTTHAIWALDMARRRGCVPQSEWAPCLAALQQELVAAQPARLEPQHSLDIDIYAERLLMLVMTDYPDPVVNTWALALLDHQDADGSWGIAAAGEPAFYRYHTTYASSWALAEWYRRLLGHPELRPAS